MRLAGQTKLGFYPASEVAIKAILTHLMLDPAPPRPNMLDGGFQILDPCAGEGLALGQLARGLGIAPDHVYAVELDGGRADRCRDNLDAGANVLGPASFMGTRMQAHSIGLVYCNPPFDDELGGGGRQEETFARKATVMLPPGGILVLVMPQTCIANQQGLQMFLDANFDPEESAIFAFPDDVRHYREVVFIGKKRRVEGPADRYDGLLVNQFRYRYGRDVNDVVLPVVGVDSRVWSVPRAWVPRFFAKIQMTDAEMVAAVENSPLLAALKPPKDEVRKRPPLPLYKGHVALLLASGMLDGVIHPEGEPPHVVRGTARKVTFLADKTETMNPETGNVTEKEVWSQKIVLTVRAVGADGQIKTFEDGEKPVSATKEMAQ